MYNTIAPVPAHLIEMVDAVRARLHAPTFSQRHRVRPEDFTRQRVLTFGRVWLLILQKSTKAVSQHLREFLSQFAEKGSTPQIVCFCIDFHSFFVPFAIRGASPAAAGNQTRRRALRSRRFPDEAVEGSAGSSSSG